MYCTVQVLYQLRFSLGYVPVRHITTTNQVVRDMSHLAPVPSATLSLHTNLVVIVRHIWLTPSHLMLCRAGSTHVIVTDWPVQGFDLPSATLTWIVSSECQ